MNTLDPLNQGFPEEFDGTLETNGRAVSCSFNQIGNFLAVGYNDGTIAIWDYMTRCVSIMMSGHNRPVSSISWSEDSHNILSSSTDFTVCFWDILKGECLKRIRFHSPILHAQINPRNNGMFLICPMLDTAILVQIDGTKIPLPTVGNSHLNIVATFDPQGNNIFLGNTEGNISIVDTVSLKSKATLRVTTGSFQTSGIRSIEFSKDGDFFLVNTSDRLIRVYDTNQVLDERNKGKQDPIKKLQDIVNKSTWKKCCFSGDGDYICGGSAGGKHSLFVWERSTGNLIKILHGLEGEWLLDIAWHPLSPVIASVAGSVVSLWSQPRSENWNAFAPDFKEIDYNQEYREHESEFDAEDEDRTPPPSPQSRMAEDSEDVDVCALNPYYFSNGEEQKEHLSFIPIAPEFEGPLMPQSDHSPKEERKKRRKVLKKKRKRRKMDDISRE